MQERPIINLLANCLWKQKPKYAYALERYEHHDLTVNGKHLEFKFNYDTCAEKLKKELGKLGESLTGKPTVETKGNWGVAPRIWKDLSQKKPHLFVWIICERDLGSLSRDELERICYYEPLLKYRRSNPYKTGREFLGTVDGFLGILQGLRPFSVLPAEIKTNGDFPSIYHFRICEFLQPLGSAGASPSRSACQG